MRAALFIVDLMTGALDWQPIARVELKQSDGTARALSRWVDESYARRLASGCQKQLDDGDVTFEPSSVTLSWWWRSRSPRRRRC